jgi:hypothetical protein
MAKAQSTLPCGLASSLSRRRHGMARNSMAMPRRDAASRSTSTFKPSMRPWFCMK